MVDRVVKLSKSHSFFLFGNRGVGKSTLLRALYPAQKSFWVDLLDPKTERAIAMHPELLNDLLSAAKEKFPRGSYVVIDEIQKIPKLLPLFIICTLLLILS